MSNKPNEKNIDEIMAEFDAFMQEIFEIGEDMEKFKQYLTRSPKKYWEAVMELNEAEQAETNKQIAEAGIRFTREGIYIDDKLVYRAENV